LKRPRLCRHQARPIKPARVTRAGSRLRAGMARPAPRIGYPIHLWSASYMKGDQTAMKTLRSKLFIALLAAVLSLSVVSQALPGAFGPDVAHACAGGSGSDC